MAAETAEPGREARRARGGPARGWRGVGRALLGLAVSLGCLVYVLPQVDLDALWQQTRQLNLLYVLGLNLLLALSLLLRSRRWQLLLRPIRPCDFGALFSANLIGFAANNLLPTRLGEAVRVWAGARLNGLSLGSSAASIVLERMLDGPVMLAFIFAVLLCLEPGAAAGPFSAGHFRAAGWTFLVGYLAALLGLLALARWPRLLVDPLARGLARLHPRWGVRLRRGLLAFHQGLLALSRQGLLGRLVLLSLALRLPLLAMHWLFLPAVGLPPSLLLAALATLGAGLASTLPAGPGYVGAYQLAVFWALRLGDAPEPEAWAYAILYWAAQWFPLVLVGLIEAWRRGLGPGRRPADLRSPEQQP